MLLVCIYLDFSTETAAGCLGWHDAYALICSMVLGLQRIYSDKFCYTDGETRVEINVLCVKLTQANYLVRKEQG